MRRRQLQAVLERQDLKKNEDSSETDKEEADEAQEEDDTFFQLQKEADVDCRGGEKTDDEIVDQVKKTRD